MFIGFMGLDGAGKTTLAEMLYSHLKRSRNDVVYLHWIGCSLTTFIHQISIKLKKILNRGPAQLAFNPQTSLASTSAFQLSIRTVLLVLNLILIKFRIILHELRGKIVICDRYFFDELVHLRYLGLNDLIFNIFLYIVPNPKNLIYIEVPPDLARERKPEHNTAYYTQKYEIYKYVVKKKNITTIKSRSLKKNFDDLLSRFENCW